MKTEKCVKEWIEWMHNKCLIHTYTHTHTHIHTYIVYYRYFNQYLSNNNKQRSLRKRNLHILFVLHISLFSSRQQHIKKLKILICLHVRLQTWWLPLIIFGLTEKIHLDKKISQPKNHHTVMSQKLIDKIYNLPVLGLCVII